MTERISMIQLENSVSDLNEVTDSPQMPYMMNVEGRYTPQAHNYHLDIAYGGFALSRMCATGSGVHTTLNRTTKRHLYNQIQAMIAGVHLGKGIQQNKPA